VLHSGAPSAIVGLRVPTLAVLPNSFTFYAAVDSDDMLLNRERPIAAHRGLDSCLGDASATGDFHACDRQSAGLRLLHDRCELLGIMREVIQLRASDDDRSAAQISSVKIRHRERYTIGANEKIGTLKEGRLRRHEHKLHRPVTKR